MTMTSNPEFDNNRSHDLHGFDAGRIVDGTVVYHDVLNRYVIVDDDGIGFDIQPVFKELTGKKVRLTLISFESMDEIEKILKSLQTND